MINLDRPLVTVGIPTYNRSEGLLKALDSVRNQSYSELEILVSDNASTDKAHLSALENIAKGDPRVTFYIQQSNIGAVPNFNFLLKKAKGDFFMWLADDDWIEENYIEKCMEVHLNEEGITNVAGIGIHYDEDNDKEVIDAVIDSTDSNTFNRLWRYFNAVSLNSIFYGVYLRRALVKAKLEHKLGSDWTMVAQVTAQGFCTVTTKTKIHRSIGGASKSRETLARQYGLNKLQSLFIYHIILLNQIKSIHRGVIKKSLTIKQRLSMTVQLIKIFKRRFLGDDWNQVRTQLLG